MLFDTLLGNQRLMDQLRQSLARGRSSHFYVISGPEGSGKTTLSQWLAAALMCEGENPPCGNCAACRKIAAGLHPDFITVDDPEKKTVPVDLIRQTRTDVYIRPNEGRKKIYRFPRGQDIGIPGQNALLKILEEPPAYGVFLLLTNNPAKLLPTIRSRCVELAMQSLPPEVLERELQRRHPDSSQQDRSAAIARSGGYLGQALQLLEEGSQLPQHTQDFAAAMDTRDALALTRLLVPMEKWKRDQLIPALEQWTQLLEQALVCRSTGQAVSDLARRLATSRTGPELYQAIGHLQKCTQYAQGNVSCAAICGYLQWALR